MTGYSKNLGGRDPAPLWLRPYSKAWQMVAALCAVRSGLIPLAVKAKQDVRETWMAGNRRNNGVWFITSTLIHSADRLADQWKFGIERSRLFSMPGVKQRFSRYRCLSATNLSSKCQQHNFRLYLRAHNVSMKIFSNLQDATENKVRIASCHWTKCLVRDSPFPYFPLSENAAGRTVVVESTSEGTFLGQRYPMWEFDFETVWFYVLSRAKFLFEIIEIHRCFATNQKGMCHVNPWTCYAQRFEALLIKPSLYKSREA